MTAADKISEGMEVPVADERRVPNGEVVELNIRCRLRGMEGTEDGEGTGKVEIGGKGVPAVLSNRQAPAVFPTKELLLIATVWTVNKNKAGPTAFLKN